MYAQTLRPDDPRVHVAANHLALGLHQQPKQPEEVRTILGPRAEVDSIAQGDKPDVQVMQPGQSFTQIRQRPPKVTQ